MLVADVGRRPRDLVGKMDYCLVFFIKELAAVVKDQRLYLLVGDANPLRRSGMRFGSILASIQHGGLEVGKLLVSLLQGARAGDSGIKWQEMFQHFWLVGQHPEEVRHTSKLLFHG